MTEMLALDHVNLRTGRVEEMSAWYQRVLGLTQGPRPDFPFPGAWLYAGQRAVVHLVGRDPAPAGAQDDLHLEHFALSARGLTGFVARLDAEGLPNDLRRVPGLPIVQINIWDPDGNHIHVDFDLAEAEAAGLAL